MIVTGHGWRRMGGVAVLAAIVLVLGCSSRDCDCPCGPSCNPGYPPDNSGKVTITQGIWGDVWFWRGSFMPNSHNGTITAVAREMRIHEITRLDQVDQFPYTATFYTAIHTALVATVHSDEAGFFQVELPPGRYSLFSVEDVLGDTLFYANEFDLDLNICPVLVEEGKVTHTRFAITYAAHW